MREGHATFEELEKNTEERDLSSVEAEFLAQSRPVERRWGCCS